MALTLKHDTTQSTVEAYTKEEIREAIERAGYEAKRVAKKSVYVEDAMTIVQKLRQDEADRLAQEAAAREALIKAEAENEDLCRLKAEIWEAVSDKAHHHADELRKLHNKFSEASACGGLAYELDWKADEVFLHTEAWELSQSLANSMEREGIDTFEEHVELIEVHRDSAMRTVMRQGINQSTSPMTNFKNLCEMQATRHFVSWCDGLLQGIKMSQESDYKHKLWVFDDVRLG